jgi:two-component system sensor histidine kinase KdpD
VVLYDLLFWWPGGPAGPNQPYLALGAAAILAVVLVARRQVQRSRQEAQTAEARARRTLALNALALELARTRSAPAIAAALARAVHTALHASAQLIAADAQGQLQPTGSAEQRRVVQAAWTHAQEAGAGAAFESQARLLALPLRGAQGLVGVVVVDRLAGDHEALDDQQMLRAFVNQAAVALERSVFEERMARVAVEAERERLRNTLLAGLAHDFRTPLTTIVGAATSLLEQGHAIDAEHRDALLRSVLGEARRLHALGSDMLDLTRMQEGAVEPQLEWCPADELVEEARAALGAALDTRSLRVDVPADLVVWCDPRLVGQVIVNLLDNAVTHTPADAAIAVSIDTRDDVWQLVVHDDGPGIPDREQREVFKKFTRGEGSAGVRGTGLGLAICAAVAQLHGGSIRIANASGARFEMSLPQPARSALALGEAA